VIVPVSFSAGKLSPVRAIAARGLSLAGWWVD